MGVVLYVFLVVYRSLLSGVPPSLYIGGWVSGTVSEEDYKYGKEPKVSYSM
jgi:hypothetical protein